MENPNLALDLKSQQNVTHQSERKQGLEKFLRFIWTAQLYMYISEYPLQKRGGFLHLLPKSRYKILCTLME
jgi:hypothetical protein